jgi:Holliday junction resolvase RusA-like endonuclease
MTGDQYRQLKEQLERNSKKKLNFPEARREWSKLDCEIPEPSIMESQVAMTLPKHSQPFKFTTKDLEDSRIVPTNPPVKANFDPDHPKSRFVVPGPPMPAPRMTQSDRWKKRPCVLRYFEYRDRIQQVVGDLPTVPPVITLEFHIAMPEKSWSKKKMAAMNGMQHCQRPDADNFCKACLDSLFLNDGGVSDLTIRKRWCYAGQERTIIEF